MIVYRPTVTFRRCQYRWLIRGYLVHPVKPRALTPIKLSAPSEDLWRATSAAVKVYAGRKRLKQGTDIFKEAWYKSRGYEIDQK